MTRDEAEGSSNAAEGSKGEEKDDMCKKPVEATGGAQAGDSGADIASSSESNNVEDGTDATAAAETDGEGEVVGDAPSEPSQAAASETRPPQSELDGGGRDPLAGAFGGLHPDNPAIDPPPSVGDATNGPTLAKALLSPAPAPVLDPAPALTLASPFGDAGPVANGLVPAAHKGDGSGLGSGADAIDAFWSSIIVGGSGQLDSSTAVVESTGGGVGCDWGGFGGVGVQGNGLNGRGLAWDLVGIREEAGGRGCGNGFANEVGSEADGGRRSVFVSDDAGGEGGTVGAAVLLTDEVAGRSGGSGGGRAGEVCGGNAGASGRELMAPAVAAVEAGAVWPPVAFETATAPFDYVAFFRDMKLVSLMWRLHCSRFGLAACLASVLSCPLPSTVVAPMFFSARCGGFVFTCLGRASRETNRPPPLPSPPPPQQ